MKNDAWLEKWLDLICAKSTGGYVLELGCGSGWDTVELLSAGCNVIAADISGKRLKECADSAPCANILQMDVSKPLPFADHSVPVILASLSLHYFSWDVTMQTASELGRCVRNDGLLLARFNSTHDYHFGASTTTELEPNFYLVESRTKRFFDETSVRLFLQGWNTQFLEENIIQRYRKPKYVWEAMAIFRP